MTSSPIPAELPQSPRVRYHFHAHLHGLPREVRRAAEGVSIAGPMGGERVVTPLELSDLQRSTPLTRSFEEVGEQLSQLARLYFEPDGSFVWVGEGEEEQSTAGSRWQVDGNLYDLNGQLLYVELKGHCPPEMFDELLRACGWPEQPVMFQLLRHALYLDESSFRHWATTSITQPSV